jgi:DNA-binding transcriptional ArsR family regulator
MDARMKSDEGQEPTDDQVRVAVDTFRLLVDPTRLRLLWALADGAELDVTTLADMLGVAQPAMSQHLARLRLAGAVDVRKDGRRSLYSIRGVHLRRVIAEGLFHADHTLTGEPPHD